jgi:hypothetical protein
MQPNQPTAPVTQPGGGPSGGGRKSTWFIDADGRHRTSRIPVPVDKFGRLAGSAWKCPKDAEPTWMPTNTKDKPVCEVHDRFMEPASLRRAPVLPWRGLWDAVERPLRPVWTLPALAAVGIAVDAAPIPAVVLVGAAPLVGEAARRATARVKATRAAKGSLGDAEDVEHFRLLISELAPTFARTARLVGYGTTAGLLWLGLADALDAGHPTPWTAAALSVAALAAWAPFAGAWWRRLRAERDKPAPQPTRPAAPPEPSADELSAAEAAKTWRSEMNADGTKLDEGTWQKIACGWQAVVVATKRGALNALGGDFTNTTIKRVAAAFDVPKSAVTWLEEYEDSPNKALLLVQPSNPLAEPQLWGGPSTVDMGAGVAESGRLIDGTVMYDTLYRYGWGAPSEVALGTTGGGKSQRARKRMLIERYASFVDDTGVRRGTHLTILHDPKRLETYAEFRDAVFAYGITRDDAHIIVDALNRECERRYDWLSTQEWTDAKGRSRRGGLAWNPLIHGPVISHFWDEFHFLTGDGEFVKKLETLGRLQRAAGMRAMLLSHMGTLGDTGSQALRDMLASGRATLFRTTSAMNAGLVTGGQLTGDPRALPRQPGMCFVADGETASMMGRESYVPGDEDAEKLGATSLYDWLFDDDNNPIGFPAEVPPETAEAFGEEFMQWAEAGRLPGGREAWRRSRPSTPEREPAATRPDVRCVDAVASQLAVSPVPMDMDALSSALSRAGYTFSVRTIRGALTELRKQGTVFSSNGFHEPTPQVRDSIERQMQVRLEEANGEGEPE